MFYDLTEKLYYALLNNSNYLLAYRNIKHNNTIITINKINVDTDDVVINKYVDDKIVSAETTNNDNRYSQLREIGCINSNNLELIFCKRENLNMITVDYFNKFYNYNNVNPDYLDHFKKAIGYHFKELRCMLINGYYTFALSYKQIITIKKNNDYNYTIMIFDTLLDNFTLLKSVKLCEILIYIYSSIINIHNELLSITNTRSNNENSFYKFLSCCSILNYTINDYYIPDGDKIIYTNNLINDKEHYYVFNMFNGDKIVLKTKHNCDKQLII